MTRDDLVTFDGITQSIDEWALDYGVTPQTIMRRLHAGASVEIAITKPMIARPGDQLPEPIVARPRTIKVVKPRAVDRHSHDGKSLTVTEWAAITGISPETMRSRIKAGHPMKDVLRKGNLPKSRRSNFKVGQPRPVKLYSFKGMTRSLSHWSTQTGIQYATLLRRMKQGATIEQALTAKHGDRPKTLHTIDGVSKTLREWAAHAGIKYQALIARIHKGRSLAEAVAMSGPRRRASNVEESHVEESHVEESHVEESDDRGVPRDLTVSVGTGGGSTAQESTNIGFSK
ncbi:hypothetical protein [Mesorhizobium cantuariense]|uniref:Uncharacterized protein n=1 Tax=Mesorhizobium cantuariense TaxID=1300275 RepID=A0ABV7MNK4_9HYPH